MRLQVFQALILVFACVCLAQDTGANDLPKVDNPLIADRVGSQTDSELPLREAEKKGVSVERFEFQAEVNRLMDIIINSLYSKKEIFLRELISNASDALDKIRYISLTNSTALGEGDTRKLEIMIEADKQRKTLSIRDRGIGMTRSDLINNLGTIAKSGTSKFLEAVGNSTDMNLIGQFGVGFYSVYLVADTVTVTTKHTDDDQYIWESKADSSYTITKDPEGPSLGRGTKITLHLKEDASDYLEQDKLKELVKRYSEFINFPILLYTSKEVEVEVPVEEEVKDDKEKEEADSEKAEAEKGEDEREEDEEDGEAKDVEDEDEPKTKKIRETKWEWTQLNDVKAIWTREPKSVPKEDYTNFYKTLTKNFEDPLGHVHFKAEGEVEFRSVLFIPGKAPSDLWENYNDKSTNLKLFVRRVFITDEFDDLMPKYLRFVQGIVDSDDLPLNVSREMLQQHKMLKIIKKKIVRKLLDLFKALSDKAESKRLEALEKEKKQQEPKDAKTAEETAKTGTASEDQDKGDASADKKDAEGKEKTDDAAKESSGDEEKEEEKEDAVEKYKEFWKNYGKNIKLGVVEDSINRGKLAKLLRFFSSKSGDNQISLSEYVQQMKPGQKFIYFLSGESKDSVSKSPFLERLLKKGYDVLYFVDPIDEYVSNHLSEFEIDKETKYKLMSASKEGLKLGDDDEKEKKKERALKEEFAALTDWFKDALTGKVEKVAMSKRLQSSPAIIVTGQYGWTANMERIMKAQALNDPQKYSYMMSKKILELNPLHPIVRELNALVKADKTDPLATELALSLYDSAMLSSGFSLEDPNSFSDRIHRLLKRTLNVDPDAAVSEEDLTELEKSEPVDDEKKDDAAEGVDEDESPEKDEL